MIETETLLIYTLLAMTLIMLIWAGLFEWRLRRFFRGKQGANLEEVISSLLKHQKEMETFRSVLEEYLRSVEKRVKRSVQSIETIRFNPFRGDGSGGNQSFSTAFLDEEGNGVVISSLFARERVHTYSKPVQHFTSTFELTEEEKTAIERARRKTSNAEAQHA
jgi:hypothetical protein